MKNTYLPNLKKSEMPYLRLLPLCAKKTAEHVELLQLETSGIRVAEYLTERPPRHLLETKLHEAIRLAREQKPARFQGWRREN